KKQKVKSAEFVEGTCAAMSSLFLRRMLDNGSVTEPGQLGASVSIRMVRGGEWSSIGDPTAIAQAAYVFGTITDKNQKVAMTRLLEVFGLKVVDDLSITFTGDA